MGKSKNAKPKAKSKAEPVPARHTGPRDKVLPGFEDANKHRLRRSGIDGKIIGTDGVRRMQDPFDVLRARELLAKDNRPLNDVLWHAGNRYREHWHGAGMAGAQAMDLTRDVVDGGQGAGGLCSSEQAVYHRQHYRSANIAIGPRNAAFIVGIVLQGMPAHALRHLVNETQDRDVAVALVIDRLREALHRLCDLWGMHPDGNRRRRLTSHWRMEKWQPIDAEEVPES